MPTVAFKTLGCRLNQAETDQIAEDLISIGFELVDPSSNPDVVIVNTCAVTKEATAGSRRASARAIKTNPEALVVVAGCYAVAEREEAERIEGVGLVVTNDEKEQLAQIISSRLGLEKPPDRPLLTIGKKPSATGRTRINLKVQTGCDEWCTFCIIPTTRGPLRSYPLEELIATARRKVAEGARELVLTGVHLGKYGWDVGRPDDALVELLERLLDIDGLARIRLSSILSRHLTKRVVNLIASEDRLCRFLHVPLQAGHDRVLTRMNRPYRIGDYLETIDRVKESIPGLALSTDVIVGFPGETVEEFEDTLHVCDHVGFMKIHAFRFSPRPNTPSATWEDQISDDEKKRRSRELIELGERTRAEFHLGQVGKTREVFVETAAAGELSGHTDDFVRIRFEGDASLVDKLARVQIVEAAADGVRGKLLSEIPWSEADPRDRRVSL